MYMTLSSSERLQQKLDGMNKFIHRATTSDSSLNTWRVQARAGKVEIPQQVQTTVENDGNACVRTIQGKGTNMEYLSVLRRAESCAVCADVDPMVNSNRMILIPGASTTLLSTGYTNAPCRIPGFQVFKLPRLISGKNCNYNFEYYGSHP